MRRLLAVCALVLGGYLLFRCSGVTTILYDRHLAAADRHKAGRDYPAMEKSLRAAMRYGDEQRVCTDLSWAQSQQVKGREALDTARKCVKRHGENAGTLLQLAEAALCADDADLAQESLRKVPPKEAADAALRAWPQTYELTWTFYLRRYRLENGWLTLGVPAPLTPYQRATVSFSGVGAQEAFTLHGNPAVRVRPSDPVKFQMRASATLSPGSLSRQLEEGSRLPASKGPKEFLEKTSWIDPEGALAKDVAKGCAGLDPVATVRCINGWFRTHTRWAVSGPKETSEFTLRTGKGNCVALTNAFVAVCRAAGIPSRPVRGMWADVAEGREGRLVGHSWAEVHIPSAGWVQVEPGDDASFGRLGTTRTLFFHYGDPSEDPLFSLGSHSSMDSRFKRTTPDPL